MCVSARVPWMCKCPTWRSSVQIRLGRTQVKQNRDKVKLQKVSRWNLKAGTLRAARAFTYLSRDESYDSARRVCSICVAAEVPSTPIRQPLLHLECYREDCSILSRTLHLEARSPTITGWWAFKMPPVTYSGASYSAGLVSGVPMAKIPQCIFHHLLPS